MSSSGKADSGSILKSLRRTERPRAPNTSRYPSLGERGRGRGRGGRGGGGRGDGLGGGGGGGGVDFEPPPSAEGDVAPDLFLEGGPSTDEVETETEAPEVETSTETGAPKKLKLRGESRVPEEKDWPKTEEEKILIIPSQAE